MLSRKRAIASPSISSAASGCPSNLRALTPSQRANAALTPAMCPDASAQATGVLTVVLVPTRQTSVAALSGLSTALSGDARTADSLAVVAAPAWSRLTAAWPAHATFTSFAEAVRMSPPPLAAPMRLPS